MNLSRQTIKNISSPDTQVPSPAIFSLPEKVLQFGTGVLLRGLPDYFIDKANRKGIFNGRVVVVKSTSHGGTDAFGKQDGLYTLCVRGIEEGHPVDETIINASISRVVEANGDWDSVLACANDPLIQIIISNTTEVGITLVEDDIHLSPPLSFPGKLLSFLYERFKVFGGTMESGMVIIPTELITDNGNQLRSIVLELAAMNKLGNNFIEWLKKANHFCNSLVDRIVPGKLTEQDKYNTEKRTGYTDDLMIMAESFRLWAIESADPRVKQVLSFSEADEGVVIAPDIEKFRELKLRLLNGTHTFSCGLAYLAGLTTVREAMGNQHMSSYIQNLALHEIVPVISNGVIHPDEATAFALKVFDRFRNPFIDHPWMNISVQYSLKMKMRNIPLLVNYYTKANHPPEHMALGFAAFLLFMKCSPGPKGNYTGYANGTSYLIQDEYAHYFANKWHDQDPERVVETVLADTHFWGTDLSRLPGFIDVVKLHLKSLIKNGVMTSLRRVELNKTIV